MDLRKILISKARSCTCLKLDITYEDIQKAIAENNMNRHLNAIVSTCKANPVDTAFVIYKTDANGILVVFGNPVVSIIMESSSLQEKLMKDVVSGYTYLWCHSLKT